jgi:hypothetical protein
VGEHRLVQAELSTLRIALVPLSEEDLEYEVELDSGPDVMRYLCNGRPSTREVMEQAHRDRRRSPHSVPAPTSGRTLIGNLFTCPMTGAL